MDINKNHDNNSEKTTNFYEKISKTKGLEIHIKIRGLSQSKGILDRNYFWLMQHQEFVTKHKELMYLKNQRQLDDFQLEFARHLHNYLASVKSLVDHTRTLKRSLKLDDNFCKKYDEKRKLLLGSDTISFVQDLREYAQHYELPPTGIVVTVNDKIGENIVLEISSKTLSKFSGWSNASKKVLKSQGENLPILDFVRDYQEAINRFYIWFWEELERNFKMELDEFNELRKQYKKHIESIIKKK